MRDLIDRQAAVDALKKAYWDKDIQSAKDDPCIVDAMTDWAIRQVKALPPTQPEPKRGKWLDANICGELPVIVCNQCNTFYPLSFGEFHNFCPNCGADMRGE